MQEPALHPLPRRRLGLAAVLVAAIAMAWPMQGGGSLQNAHYVLVMALASGTPTIERVLADVDAGTNDTLLRDGRLYSNKAPGFAATAAPAFVALRAVGVGSTGNPVRMLWALGLVVAVLPALALMLLVRRVADDLEPGFGTAAAVTLGLGTLVFPFVTLFLQHVLSAFLVFGAFALLWRARRRPDARLTAAAGLLAGIAVVVEYPNALGVALLGLYGLAGGTGIRRAAAFGAGAIVGAAPLLAYNLWAFGEAFTSSYAADAGGNTPTQFGVPRPVTLLELFLSQQGLLVASPVLAAALVGLVLLYRGGARAEALVAAGVVLGYALVSAAYYSHFGGFSPGPRYLIVTMPFLALGLASAFRAAPIATGALAATSIASMALLTASHPLAGYDGAWADRIARGDVPLTAAGLVGVTGWSAILPLFLACALAGWLALRATPRVPLRPLETLVAGGGVLTWALLATTARDGDTGGTAPYATAGALLAAAAVAVLVARTRETSSARAVVWRRRPSRDTG